MGRIVRKRTQQKPQTAKVKPTAQAAKKTVAKTKSKKHGSKKAVKRRTTKHNEQTVCEFRLMVNISSEHLSRWLNTAESRKLFLADATNDLNGTSVLTLLKRRKDKYTESDFDQMQTVVDAIKQRLEKRPKGDIVASNWRYSLMNWGHDPTKRMRRTTK